MSFASIRKTLSALLAIVVLAACGGGTSGGSSPAVTVSIWSWRSQDAALWRTVEQQLRSQGTNVHIDYQTKIATQYDAALQTAMTGGQGPDLFYGRAGSGTIKYAAAHLITPVDGNVDLSGIASSTLPTVAYQGKHYGVPFAVQTMEVFYNKQIFQQHHLQVPKTWNDLITICNQLEKDGVQPFYAMGTAQQWLLALSAFEIAASTVSNRWSADLVGRKAQYTSPQWVEALSRFKQISQYFEPNYMAAGQQPSEADQALALGKAAMVFDGIFDTPTMLQFNPSLQLGAFLVPPGDQKQQSSPADYTETKAKVFWYPDGDFVMNSNIQDKAVRAAALKILQFTATRQFGQSFSNVAGEISPLNGVQISKSHPLAIQAEHWFQTDRVDPSFGIRGPLDTPPVQPVGGSSPAPGPNTNTGVYAALQALLPPMLEGKATPQQTAEALQQQVAWYNRSS